MTDPAAVSSNTSAYCLRTVNANPVQANKSGKIRVIKRPETRAETVMVITK
jgi:hypothetical protein